MSFVAAYLLLVQSAPTVKHFDGEAYLGRQVQIEIGPGLLFRLTPTETGWELGIVPKTQCERDEDWAEAVNIPLRGRTSLDLDSSYGVPAAEAVQGPPREFSFVVTCEDYKLEAARRGILLWPQTYPQKQQDEALDKFATSPLGKARFTVLKFRVSGAKDDVDGKNYGQIDWIKFRLDVTFPAQRTRR